MRALSAAQRTALRSIKDKGENHTLKGNYTAVTLASLMRRGLVTIDGETMEASLTLAGERAYVEIVASGDGPEDLKAMFRPLFGGSRR